MPKSQRSKVSRRRFVALASTAVVGSSCLPNTAVSGSNSHGAEGQGSTTPPDGRVLTKVDAFPVRHGGIKPVWHDRLRTKIAGQTAVATLRFYRPVRVTRIEIPAIVYARDQPSVPSHLAHVAVSVFRRTSGQWEVIRDVAFPPNPKFAGQGLSQDTRPEVMQQFFEQAIKEHSPWTIDLGGLETDHVRLECDREHPTWSNARECNGGPYNVPFGVFHNAVVYGEPLAPRPAVAPYEPVLRHGVIRPVAPTGMTVERKADSVQFRSSRLSVGFLLNRPMLAHLGWDALGKGRADINRLLSTRTWAVWAGCNRKVDLVGGLTGPVLRTLDYDIASHLWTGRVDVEGNEVRYSDLMAIEDVRLDVVFRVMEDRIQVTVDQTCRRPVVAIEYEAWRFAWDAKTSPTGVSGAPTQKPGRNGHVELPVYLTGEGSGCLSFSAAGAAGSSAPESYLQVESYREAEALTCGVVPAERSPDGFGVVLPEGKRHHEFQLVVTNLQPRRVSSADDTHLTDGIRQHWATVFSCYRPEYRGFSNNCISVNCHQGQWSQTEVLLHTEQPAGGPDLAAMHRYTVEKALLDGGGYGYWREYYMDSDPSLLCAAGTAYRMDASVEWLQRIRVGLVEVFERMVSTSGNDGLLVNLHRSGNTGEFTLSTNGIDVVRFGHLDAFSNAWAYRALRNVAPIFAALGDSARAATALDIATRMRQSYGRLLLNPETGWIAGWRSRDGKLHDYGYLGINGVAIAFGLLDADAARKALARLERRRAETCPVSAQLGLPVNLIPHAYEDHYFHEQISNSTPTFELYCDGGFSAILVGYYLRELSQNGFSAKARELAGEFDRGYAAGLFSGGVGSGNEMRSWEGLPSGYEGTLTYNHGLVYAIAVEKGIIQPLTPEWWPAMPS